MTNPDTTRIVLTAVLACACLLSATTAHAQYVMENLGRGLIVMRSGETSAYVGWRLLGTDPDGVGFNVYRTAGAGSPVRLNKTVLTKTTDFVDTSLDPTAVNAYTVRAVMGGRELDPSGAFVLPANATIQQYLTVPLQRPAGGEAPGPAGAPAPYTYNANDASVADLDGDGENEIVLKWHAGDRTAAVRGSEAVVRLGGHR